MYTEKEQHPFSMKMKMPVMCLALILAVLAILVGTRKFRPYLVLAMIICDIRWFELLCVPGFYVRFRNSKVKEMMQWASLKVEGSVMGNVRVGTKSTRGGGDGALLS